MCASAWAERGRYYNSISQPAKAAADFAQALTLGHRDARLLDDIINDEALLDRVLGQPLARSAEVSRKLFLSRAEHLAKRRHWNRASTDYQSAAALSPLNTQSSYQLVVTLLHSGEREALRLMVADLLSRFRNTTEHFAANSVAWTCVLAGETVSDHEAPVRLAEIALKGWTEVDKHQVLITLGAALYRVGRFEDAIRRLEEKIRARFKGSSEEPQDWPFLAMAHHRLGHRDEARRWLEKLRNRQPSTDSDKFWDELEIRLLSSEAEAVVLYDPIFPADPFAH